jgi:hypothetical protein
MKSLQMKAVTEWDHKDAMNALQQEQIFPPIKSTDKVHWIWKLE